MRGQTWEVPGSVNTGGNPDVLYRRYKRGAPADGHTSCAHLQTAQRRSAGRRATAAAAAGRLAARPGASAGLAAAGGAAGPAAAGGPLGVWQAVGGHRALHVARRHHDHKRRQVDGRRRLGRRLCAAAAARLRCSCGQHGGDGGGGRGSAPQQVHLAKRAAGQPVRHTRPPMPSRTPARAGPALSAPAAASAVAAARHSQLPRRRCST